MKTKEVTYFYHIEKKREKGRHLLSNEQKKEQVV